jgi:hypothetical protein
MRVDSAIFEPKNQIPSPVNPVMRISPVFFGFFFLLFCIPSFIPVFAQDLSTGFVPVKCERLYPEVSVFRGKARAAGVDRLPVDLKDGDEIETGVSGRAVIAISQLSDRNEVLLAPSSRVRFMRRSTGPDYDIFTVELIFGKIWVKSALRRYSELRALTNQHEILIDRGEYIVEQIGDFIHVGSISGSPRVVSRSQPGTVIVPPQQMLTVSVFGGTESVGPPKSDWRDGFDPPTPPLISPVSDETIEQNGVLSRVVLIRDSKAAASELRVHVVASDQDLIPAGGIVLTNEVGDTHSMRITPAKDRTGTAMITITATNPTGAAASSEFRLTVRPPLLPPIVPIPDQEIPENSVIEGLPIEFQAAVTAPERLRFRVNSDNRQLVPETGIQLSGSGAKRALTITPSSGQTGSSTIVITVTHQAGVTRQADFTVKVLPLKDVEENGPPGDIPNTGNSHPQKGGDDRGIQTSKPPGGEGPGSSPTSGPSIWSRYRWDIVTGTAFLFFSWMSLDNAQQYDQLATENRSLREQFMLCR